MREDLDQTLSEEILKEMAELRKMMTTRRNGRRRQLEEAVEQAGKTPCTRKIEMEMIPHKYNLPVFTSIFDGSACVIQHVKAYTRSLLQWEKNDVVMCKYFDTSLAGEAMKWFEGLPVETIGSFHHLHNVLLGKYISNNMSRPGIETTFGLRRRINESLSHLTTRWRTMCSKMARRVDERYLILAFINAIFPTDLLYTQIFRIKDTITMSELREFQEEYIALEEKQRDMESYPIAVPDAKSENASLLPRMTNAVASTSQGNQRNNIAEMEQKLIAMVSADQEEFDREYKEKQLQNRGGNNKIQRMDNTPEGYGGQQPYYNKRQGTGRIVWEQINLPKLNTTVDKVWEAVILMEEIPEPHNVGDEPPPGRRIKEFCIFSFSAEETAGEGESHECPLVVKLGINPKAKVEDDEEYEANTWAINRILIDTGSSIDILFYHTYKTMGGRDDELIPSTYKIYGFNGTSNKPKGEVTMRILLQNLPTKTVFCVVDVESPYNAMIGRRWCWHIRGDTVESRSCQEIDFDKCEEREGKQRNWKKHAADSQRAKRLMVDLVSKVGKTNKQDIKAESSAYSGAKRARKITSTEGGRIQRQKLCSQEKTEMCNDSRAEEVAEIMRNNTLKSICELKEIQKCKGQIRSMKNAHVFLYEK
ncbi:uncharacterized protein LOC113294826 [Papaver somniferum]|uniref:uncharacterized protein LOC113294826 n=1 Tax=Papaver somniferum TaxID=3469 RepID=UPI000E704F8E|nr:uncharacterized protein LOC113294826 [Papaver somniferum]